MFKTLIENIPLLVVSIIATVTGGTAVSKIANELHPLIAEEREIQEISIVTPTVTSTPSVSPSTSTPTTVPTSMPTTASATAFTSASLSLHNKQGDCYVAYNKIVYNVSTHPSWKSCRHHGISGGSDITSRFPHSTSYFATLQKVGTLNGGSTSSANNPRQDDDDSAEDEKENEQEDDEEDEKDEVEIEEEHEEDYE